MTYSKYGKYEIILSWIVLLIIGFPKVQVFCQHNEKIPAYKDYSISFEARAADLLSRMTLEEKVAMLGGENMNTKENKRLGIPKILITDGPLGPTSRKQSTNYSAMINLAAFLIPI
jgi:hypothetical protein